MDVKDRIAIVTGASSGIGLAAARLLTEKGAKVALVARSADKLKSLEAELEGSFALPADMTIEEDVRHMVNAVRDHYGRIDILVNNAGRGYDSPVEHTDLAIFRKIFDLDLAAPVLAMKLVIPVMRSQGGGTIVNISSGTALMNLPDMAPYACLKKALAYLSLTAREELKDDGIVVSTMYPYVTSTDFEKNTIKDDSLKDEEFDESELPHPPDSPGYAAQKLLEGIISGDAEIFAHDWMKGER